MIRQEIQILIRVSVLTVNSCSERFILFSVGPDIKKTNETILFYLMSPTVFWMIEFKLVLQLSRFFSECSQIRRRWTIDQENGLTLIFIDFRFSNDINFHHSIVVVVLNFWKQMNTAWKYLPMNSQI